MILSDRDIKKAFTSKRVVVTPAPDLVVQLGSCSLDLRLGNTFRVFNHGKMPYIDTKHPPAGGMMDEVKVKDGEPFILQPGDFVLAVTLERVKIADDLLARLEGRSSLGRLGIVVHSTASVFDPGWDGNLVLELGNLGRIPVALYPGMRICALTFEELSSPAQVPYNKKKGAKYRGQNAPLASKISEEQ